ncbi:nucleoid-associated protein [Modicisalibacter tunisiensis]|uniref:nucleoid-associated protein n=1 Tax=Modicisalibacter tunisiensis TaxID=390637 RepID=UPI001CCB5007|nr:nucleoid-associated protein [Modicisalibacter tunisiensis]MBZ9540245.1 nucleoid-associated protein [Modicisalibacter tunisiensis]
MPILHCIVHRIDKADGEQPAALTTADTPQAPSPQLDDLLAELTTRFNAKRKGWGYFREDAAGRSLAALLPAYLDSGEAEPRTEAFATLSRQAAESLRELVEQQLPTGGYLLMAHVRQGETEHLTLALLHARAGFGVDAQLAVVPAAPLNVSQPALAARIDLTQMRAGHSRQYVAFTRDRGGQALAEAFRDWLGCEEGADAPEETRTLLKAFSDYVESEALPEEAAREKTDALLDYASDQAGRGEPLTLDALSELVDDQQPRAFYDYIRNQDYGLAPEIPPDKRTLQQFKRFTGRAGGVSISFDSHLLGNSIEYDADRDRLIIKQVPDALKTQLRERHT